MLDFKSLFKKGAQEASAAELWRAIEAAESERRVLREREQALASERSRALLNGDDDELDRIEKDMASIQRAAERHDLRIPELMRLHEERRQGELYAVSKATFETALRDRAALCERIDAALASVGELFNQLDVTGEALKGVQDFYRDLGHLPGTMSRLQPQPDAVKMAVLDASPSFARALGIEAFGPHHPQSYAAHEAEIWTPIAGRITSRQVRASGAVTVDVPATSQDFASGQSRYR